MNRLTKSEPLAECEAMNLSLTDLYMRLKAYEDTELEPEEIKRSDALLRSFIDLSRRHARTQPWMEKVMQADAEGRLLVLPCKVVDTVYRPLYGKVWEGIVLNFCFDETVSASIQNVTGGAIVFEHKEDFGKTVFLTREEAEAALEAKRHWQPTENYLMCRGDRHA